MKLLRSRAELLKQTNFELRGIKEIIELAGRTCYKSENSITPNSSDTFVSVLIKNGHTAMLEHGSVYLFIPTSEFNKNATSLGDALVKCAEYGRLNMQDEGIYVSTNYRVISDNMLSFLLRYLCPPSDKHELRISMRFVTDRGVSHELVRHRVFSFAQESTRFCNYSKDKFDGLSYIIPSWLPELPEGNIELRDGYEICDDSLKNYQRNELENIFLNQIAATEACYLDLVSKFENRKPDRRFRTGYKGNPLSPQQARQILPNALKTEIVCTAFVSDWKHFFDLRFFGITGKPHPDMLELSTKAMKVLKDNGLWDKIVSSNPKELS